MKNYNADARLKKEALRVIVKYLKLEEIEELRKAFIYLDEDKSGFVTFEGLKKALQKMDY